MHRLRPGGTEERTATFDARYPNRMPPVQGKPVVISINIERDLLFRTGINAESPPSIILRDKVQIILWQRRAQAEARNNRDGSQGAIMQVLGGGLSNAGNGGS